MTWVKVCGLTRREDVLAAADAGADAVGFVIAPESPRAVSPAQAAALGDGVTIRRVLVTVDLDARALLAAAGKAGVDGVQPHGLHAGAAAAAAAAAGFLVLRPVPVEASAPDLGSIPADQIPLLDTRLSGFHGGGGVPFDWSLAAGAARPFVLAGGLGPDNVAAAVRRLQPWGVDASSRLEAAPGVKDAGKVAAFVAEAKRT